MSIRENDLRPNQDLQNVKVKGDVSLNTFQVLLTDKANEYGVPIKTQIEEVKKSGLLNKATVPCLEYYHPAHRSDYFHYVITSQKQGLYTYIQFFYYGSSPNNGLMNKRDEAKQKGTLTGALSGAIRSAIANSKNDQIQEEENWYATIRDIIDEIISV